MARHLATFALSAVYGLLCTPYSVRDKIVLREGQFTGGKDADIVGLRAKPVSKPTVVGATFRPTYRGADLLVLRGD